MLSNRSKYALRALMMLAAQEPDQLVLVAHIAKSRKMPKKFLELILLDRKSTRLNSSH